ncbi:hypothetical protein EDD11_007414 [Mortierella claussenii]|nr:hypothetical protein EDD11_007414 [Mortierella claussenii]
MLNNALLIGERGEMAFQYIQKKGKKATPIGFFKEHGFKSYQEGSASSEWLVAIDNKPTFIAAYHNSKRERSEFWKGLKMLEDYTRQLKPLVMEEKLAVAFQHNREFREYQSRWTLDLNSSANGEPSSNAASVTPANGASASPPTFPPTSTSTSTSTLISVSTLATTSSSAPIASAAPTTDITSMVAKKKRKIHMQEPYKWLLDAARNVHRGGMMKLTERDISNLTPTRRGLYELALDSLVCFQHDRENVSSEKDAFVALSCTLDLAGPKLQDCFEEDILKRAKDSCSVQWSSSDELMTVLEPLLTIFLKNKDPTHLRKKLLRRMANLHDLDCLEFCILSALDTIFIISPAMKVGLHAFSEADYVSIWKHLFSLFMTQSAVYMKSGETVLVSSKTVQEILNAEFSDFANFGRKVDLVFKSRDIELVNFEFKSHGVSESCLQIQHKKNIRLNRAIMEELRNKGIREPSVVFGDFEGLTGCFFSLSPFEDIFTCGLVEVASIPMDIIELEDLLRDGELLRVLITITNYIKDLENQAKHAIVANEQEHKRRKLARVYGTERPFTPPRLERTFSKSVWLTP